MKQKEWVILIILMIVIAAVVAYITGSITGNIIKVNPSYAYSAPKVYTTSEIDSMGESYTGKVNSGQTLSVILNGKTYTVRSIYIDSTKCKLCVSINGAAEEKCDTELRKGASMKLSDGKILEVRAINYAAKTGTIDSVDFSLESQIIQGTSKVALNTLNYCDRTSTFSGVSCRTTCNKMGRICVLGLIETRTGTSGAYTNSYTFATCNEAVNSPSMTTQCICCYP